MSFDTWSKERLEKQIGEKYEKRKIFDRFMLAFLIILSVVVILMSVTYQYMAALLIFSLMILWVIFLLNIWMGNMVRKKAERDITKFNEKEIK